MNSRNSGNSQPPQLRLCYRIKCLFPKTPCTAMRSTHKVCIQGWSAVLPWTTVGQSHWVFREGKIEHGTSFDRQPVIVASGVHLQNLTQTHSWKQVVHLEHLILKSWVKAWGLRWALGGGHCCQKGLPTMLCLIFVVTKKQAGVRVTSTRRSILLSLK